MTPEECLPGIIVVTQWYSMRPINNRLYRRYEYGIIRNTTVDNSGTLMVIVSLTDGCSGWFLPEELKIANYDYDYKDLLSLPD